MKKINEVLWDNEISSTLDETGNKKCAAAS